MSPMKLTIFAATGGIGRRILEQAGCWDISRADVAHLMLRVLEQPETIRQVIGIAN